MTSRRLPYERLFKASARKKERSQPSELTPSTSERILERLAGKSSVWSDLDIAAVRLLTLHQAKPRWRSSAF
jgi:hypothetical protein